MQSNRFWFFGSKLNTALLLILIIVMIFAIRIMLHDRAIYFPQTVVESQQNQNQTPQILGNKQDLVSFSINPGDKISSAMTITGAVKGGYFFEGNILINILDANKKVLVDDHAMATTDWMTNGPVSFKITLDYLGLPQGPGYIEIHNDNASGLPQNDKHILIPIVIQ